MYTTNAIRITQNGRVFYIAAIPAKKLVELTKVDEWNPNSPREGYQRAPSMSRKREIGRYAMRTDAILPIGGLVNARSKTDAKEGTYGKLLQFKEVSNNDGIGFGVLTIPDEAKPLWIVDMQHRLGGFEWAMGEAGNERLAEFPLVVTIADGLSKLEEVDQFDLINTTQKKVRTDLARRLMSIQAQDVDHRMSLDIKGKMWEAKGAGVVEYLNKTTGVWKGRILPPNLSKKDQPTMAVRETSFVTSLKPILQTPYFGRQTEEHAAQLINRYWDAIQKVFPEAFINPEEYVIQKSPGIFALHELAPLIFETARDKGELTVENIYDIVKGLGEVDGSSEYWKADNYEGAAQYGSMKGFRILAVNLKEYIPEIGMR
jgi:DGQHR domain-containing protein